MAQKETMTSAQVAKELDVSAATVRRLVERGVIAARPVSPALARPKALEIETASVMAYKAKIAKAAQK